MCGLAGIFAADPAAPIDPAGPAAMARRLAHRGPDATRIHPLAGGALVSTRLAITDPAGAVQPLTGCTANVLCVYNGEIYNFRELRERLAARGHLLHNRGDGEVITHLYEEYGTGFVDHLRGAFAIALYDAGRDELILARDRMGEKPLLYAVSGQTLCFASETRALTAATDLGEISLRSLTMYLRYGFVPEPETLFTQVRKLPAGHYAVVQRRSGWRVVLHRYWSPPAVAPPGSSDDELITAAAESFAEAVAQQTHADVPVAVALSGGIDSTLLAHVAARTLPETRTYSVGFDWMPSDEPATAAATAQHLQSKHREIRLGVTDYLDLLAEGARGLSEPIADWTMPAYLALTSSCRQDGVRVLLTGHGPDELFLAYHWTRQASAGAGPAAGERSPAVNAYRFNPEYTEAGAFLDDLLAGAAPPAATDALGHCTMHSPRGFRHALRSTLLRGYLRSNGLMQLDSLGLMKAVEVRVPYVDYRFVEAAIAADDVAVAPAPMPKHHLYAMAPLLDVHHPYVEKRPFFPPLRPLVDPISTLARRVILSGELVGNALVSPTAAARLLDSVTRYEYGLNIMFRLLIVELWLTDIAAPVA